MQNPSHRISPWLFCAFVYFAFLQQASAVGSCEPPKEGSQELKACVQFSCQAKQMCESAKNKVASENNSQAGSVGRQYQGSDQVSNPAHDMAGVAKRGADMQGKAAGYCKGLAGGSGGGGAPAAKTCQSMCDSSKAPEKEKDQMDQERQKCMAQLNQIAGALSDAEKQNKETADGSQKTGDESKSGGQQGGGDQGKGQGGQGGEQPKGEQPKEQAKNQEPQTKSPLEADCEGPQAASNAACTSKLEAECKGKFDSSPKCQAFADRYCGSSFSSASASEGSLKPASGVSSDFCQQRTASNFCKSPGRSRCPSCSGMGANLASASSSQLAEICGTCSSGSDLDPIFANPSVARACSTYTSGSGSSLNTFSADRGESIIGGSGAGAASSGGGGGGTGGATASGGEAKLGEASVKREGEQKFKTEIGGDSGGGGGGYSYGGGSSGSGASGGDDSEAAPDSGRSIASQSFEGGFKLPAGISNRSGPSVFSIQSAILRNRCDAGKFLSCRKNK